MKKRALFSLYDTTRADVFAGVLLRAGWEIIASKETVDVLAAKGLPVTDIADFTGVRKDYGFPPTLHPRVEYCLTSDNKDERIDMVYVINYPQSAGNDVGGRTLLALAAKGMRIPVATAADMELVVGEIERIGKITGDMLNRLLDKTNALISRHYDDLLLDRMPYDAIFGSFCRELANGENPYQVPATLFASKEEDRLSLCNFRQVSGDPPCFTNLADSDNIIQTMSLASEAFRIAGEKVPYICVAAKHGNPCGMAVDRDSPLTSVKRALFGNPRAIWGGEVIVNFPVDDEIAKLLMGCDDREKAVGSPSWMLDVVMSPRFVGKAVEVLGKNKNRKLLENEALSSPFASEAKWHYRHVRGGFLRQPPNNYVLDLNEAEFTGNGVFKDTDSLIVAWSVAFTSFHGGNEVAIAKESALIACGGAPSTVEAVQHALFNADYLGHDTKGSVFAADAFFPFTDAPELLAGAGVSAGLAPSGGKAQKEVETFLRENNVEMWYLDEKFRGFCRH